MPENVVVDIITGEGDHHSFITGRAFYKEEKEEAEKAFELINLLLGTNHKLNTDNLFWMESRTMYGLTYHPHPDKGYMFIANELRPNPHNVKQYLLFGSTLMHEWYHYQWHFDEFIVSREVDDKVFEIENKDARTKDRIIESAARKVGIIK